MHMAERCIYEHRPMGLSLYLSLSLSHTHTRTHTRAHTHKWDPLNYLFARDSF